MEPTQRLTRILAVILSLSISALLPAAVHAGAAQYQITRITNNGNYDDFNPKINDKGQIIWYGWHGNPDDFEIFLYNGGQPVQLTDNDYPDMWCCINNRGQLVWQGTNTGSGVYIYNNGTVTQITKSGITDTGGSPLNDLGQVVYWEYSGPYNIILQDINTGDRTPITNDQSVNMKAVINKKSQIVWRKYDGTCANLMLYNNGDIINLTNNNQPTIDYFCHQINDNGQIIWTSTTKSIYLYDKNISNAPINIWTSNNNYGIFPRISKYGVVWSGYNGLNFDIYLYDFGNHTITKIAENAYTTDNHGINDYGQVVWTASGNIYLWTNGVTTQITNNGGNGGPQINNLGQIVWHRLEGSNHDIYLATPQVAKADHVVLIIIDGLRKNALYQALASADGFPVLKSLFWETPHIRFNGIRTVVPSVTFAANASLITGLYPDKHGIPGNNWFNRFTGVNRNYVNLTGGLVYTQERANKDLRPNIRTLHDVILDGGRSCRTVFHMYGSKQHADMHPTIWVKPKRDDFTLWGIKKNYESYDRNAMWEAINSISRQNNPNNYLPDLLTIYLPGNDGASHSLGIGAQLNYLKKIDDLLGILIKGGEIKRIRSDGIPNAATSIVFEGLEQYQQNGGNVFDKTVFVILSDHGQFNIAGAADSTYDIVNPTYDPYDNGGMSQVYVRSLFSWKDFPDLEAEIKPVAKEYWDNKEALGLSDILVRDAEGANNWRANYQKYDGVTNELVDLSFGWTNKWINRLDCDRSGDILLIPKPSYSFSLDEKADHGSILLADSGVPLIFAGKPLGKFAKNNEVRSIVDVAPTIAKLLGLTMTNVDGKPLQDVH